MTDGMTAGAWADQQVAAVRDDPSVVLCRVLYTHTLVSAPRIALGWLRPLAPLLGDPRLGMAGIFLQLSRVLPDEYPLRESVQSYLKDELGLVGSLPGPPPAAAGPSARGMRFREGVGEGVDGGQGGGGSRWYVVAFADGLGGSSRRAASCRRRPR
ncbi:hypothetical protein E0H75_20540 [Kribbella capetownensis]|uniref:Uncharacterized protein n=1 Tax=Kribbella capetownensis TaxID=1572659 RepID=A0A4R0JNX0_9ACTN|nr:hypothetical protein [Kribbella capetownensis]TCC48951.1 hypothetical protein E0H75_20540 [Kribbella capetownensis]